MDWTRDLRPNLRTREEYVEEVDGMLPIKVQLPPTKRVDISQVEFMLTDLRLSSDQSVALSSIPCDPADNQVPILKLPTELLCQVVEYLEPTTPIHRHEGYGCSVEQRSMKPGISHAVRVHMREIQILRYLALVCRTLTPIAEKSLYRSIHLPQPPPIETRKSFRTTPLLLFLRTLIERPHLGALVSSLAVWNWKDGSRFKPDVEPVQISPLYRSYFEKAGDFIKTLPLTTPEKTLWLSDLAGAPQKLVCGLVLASLPNLKFFELNALPPHTYGKAGDIEEDMNRLSQGLSMTRVTHLSLCSDVTTVNLSKLKSLETLSLDYTSCSPYFRGSYDPLPRIKNLEIECRAADLFEMGTLPTDKRLRLKTLLRKLPKLESLHLQPLSGTHSWNSQGLRLNKSMREGLDDLDRHSQETANYGGFDRLLAVLKPAQKSLKSLQLPQNWYSSRGKVSRTLPILRSFKSLLRLSIPKIAVISNYYRSGHANDTTIFASHFLPSTLEYLTIFQADLDTCYWIEDVFHGKNRLPDMREIRLYFDKEFPIPHLRERLGEEGRKMGIQVVAVWRNGFEQVI